MPSVACGEREAHHLTGRPCGVDKNHSQSDPSGIVERGRGGLHGAGGGAEAERLPFEFGDHGDPR